MIGFVTAVGLLAVYGVIMTGFSGWLATMEQFQSLWWLMVPLAIGFGVQISLYVRLKRCYYVLKHSNKERTMMSVGGGSAGVGMLACCAHHATDVLPSLGLSGASIFFTRYQIPILLISLGVNGVGIVLMLRSIKRIELAV